MSTGIGHRILRRMVLNFHPQQGSNSLLNVGSLSLFGRMVRLRNTIRNASASPKSQPAKSPDANKAEGVTNESEDTLDLDAPIKFSTSRAGKLSASETLLLRPRREIPWFQPWIVSVSVGCLLIWFGILREENDIDEQLGATLWERIPGLEESQLRTVIDYNRNHGIPTAELEARLAELVALKKTDQ